MAAAALLSVTLVPALMLLFVRGRIIPEAQNPVNRALIWIYRPVIAAVLQAKTPTIVLALVILAVSDLAVHASSASEFMPNLERRHAALHADDAAWALDHQGCRTAADAGQDHQVVSGGCIRLRQGGPCARPPPIPRPTEMFETVINLKPKEEWRPGMTTDKLIARDGQGVAVPRRLERLDDADQGAHRHAGDRHPHAGRRQGDRAGPPRSTGRAANRGRRQERSRHFQRLSPNASWAATISTSCPTASSWRAMA